MDSNKIAFPIFAKISGFSKLNRIIVKYEYSGFYSKRGQIWCAQLPSPAGCFRKRAFLKIKQR